MKKAVGIVGLFSCGAYLTTMSDKDKDQEVSIVVVLQLEWDSD